MADNCSFPPAARIMSAWLGLDAAHIQVGTANRRFLRQLLGHIDMSQVFVLLYLIIRMLGQDLSERNIGKAFTDWLERLK